MSWPQACITPTSWPWVSRGGLLAGVGEAGLLDDRQRIHVGAHQDHRPRPVLDDTHDPELAHARW